MDAGEGEDSAQGFLRARLESAIVVQFVAKGLHDRDGGKRLLRLLVDSRVCLLLLIAELHHRHGIKPEHDRQPRHHQQRDERQRLIQSPHDAEHGRQRQDRRRHRQQRVFDNDGNAGAIAGVLSREEATQQKILSLALGHAPSAGTS